MHCLKFVLIQHREQTTTQYFDRFRKIQANCPAKYLLAKTLAYLYRV